MNSADLSTKYSLIKKASSNMFVAIAIASFIVSFSLVTMKFLWDLRGFNNSVESAQEETLDTLNQNIQNFSTLSEDFKVFNDRESTRLVEDADELFGDEKNKDAKLKTNSTIVLDSLPSKYDFPAIATAMQIVASRAGVQLSGFDGSDSIEGSPTSQAVPEPIDIPFNVSIEGTYEAIQRFITLTAVSVRPYYIDSVQFSGSDDALKVTMQMHTIYQPAINVNEVIKKSIEQ